MKTRLLAAVLLLLLGACASDTPSSEAPTAVETDSSERGSSGSAKEKHGKKERTAGGETPGGASAGGASAKGGDASEDRDGGSSSDAGSAKESSAYPAAGTYTFSQSGYEEFCDNAGQCDKDKLPARQPTNVTYESSSEDSALVVAEQEESDSRLTRTWTRFTSSGAHIEKMYVRFNYSGFTFERTYEPKPPVEALRFPLTAGESWSGEWRASTSGEYSVKVGRKTTLEIGGRRVAAYPVQTDVEFRGDFEGKSRITAYIDPDTKAIVATDGALNVTTRFGRYSTVFETKLASGPGY